jgi:L,D-transpeptidase YbiS
MNNYHKFFNWKFSVAIVLFVILLSVQKISIWMLNRTGETNLSSGAQDSVFQVYKASLEAVDKKNQKLQPKSPYLVVNSTANDFYLYNGKELIAHDKCSTGSYVLLKNGDRQQWIFKTPKGEYKILGKTVNPVWKKPDWAFVEEGLPVPSMNHPSRFEYGVLGDYSLNLGDGYLIHGTLYQRFIGLPVTHGCIRLDEDNLELVYKKLPVGSKVYLF